MLFSFAVMSATLMKEDSKLKKLITQSDTKYTHTRPDYFICTLLILLFGSMGTIGLTTVPKSARNRTANITKQYLQYAMEKHPELQQYKTILNDQKSVLEISAVICNGLDQKTQQQILDILNKTYDKPDKTSDDIENAEKQIILIVQQYAQKNPQYMRDVIQAIANSFKTYIMTPNQHMK